MIDRTATERNRRSRKKKKANGMHYFTRWVNKKNLDRIVAAVEEIENEQR